MEKKTPHCSLSLVKELVKAGNVRSTMSALAGAAALNYGFDDMVEIILSLTAKDFYKSMTTYTDHRIWQDVYRPLTSAGKIYIKLTVIEDVLIVSFKEL
ncbi:motility quorum-sensing regulator / GCU-specific mRNA interferase toxin [Desulfonatronum zhilinae]|nr:motility quorum-sensing regulator / GCU-specific mRNA interferase toxin [Desulfonatronum zhilinae]